MTASTLKHPDGTAGAAAVTLRTATTEPVTLGTIASGAVTLDHDQIATSSAEQVLTLTTDGRSTGTVSLVLTTVPTTTTAISPGTPARLDFTDRQNRAVTFDVELARPVVITATASGLTAPSGTQPSVALHFVETAYGYVSDAPTLSVDAPSTTWRYNPPATGIARLLLDPQGGTTGTVTLTVTPVSDVRASLVLGKPVTATTVLTGQKIVLSVPATAGPLPPAFVLSGVKLTGEDGAAPSAEAILSQSGSCFDGLGVVTATTTALRVTSGNCDFTKPSQLVIETDQVTTITLTITLIQPKLTTVAVRSGQPVRLAFARPGDTTVLTFATSGSQRVVVAGTKLTVPALAIRLAQGSTEFIHIGGGGTGTGGYDEFAPNPAKGTASLSVTPAGTQTGGVTVTVYLVTDPVVRAAADGDTRVVWSPGQNPRVNVRAAAGQRVVMQVTGTSRTGWQTVSSQIRATDLDSAYPPAIRPGDRTFGEAPVPMPADGTAEIRFDPAGAAAGWLDVRITLVTDVRKSITLNKATSVSLQHPGQNARLTVTVSEGDGVSWRLRHSTVSSLGLRLVGPYGTLASTDAVPAGSHDQTGWAGALPAGTYDVIVDPEGSATGKLTFALLSPWGGGTSRDRCVDDLRLVVRKIVEIRPPRSSIGQMHCSSRHRRTYTGAAAAQRGR